MSKETIKIDECERGLNVNTGENNALLPDVSNNEATECKYYPCMNGRYNYCDFPECEEFESEVAVCPKCGSNEVEEYQADKWFCKICDTQVHMAKQNNMNKETIEQIKQTQGDKMVTSVSEPSVRHKDLIKKEYEKGTLLEYKDKGLSEWKLFSSGVFDWQNYDYRIADPSEHWLGAVADINKSLANRIMEWFDGSVTYDEF